MVQLSLLDLPLINIKKSINIVTGIAKTWHIFYNSSMGNKKHHISKMDKGTGDCSQIWSEVSSKVIC